MSRTTTRTITGALAAGAVAVGAVALTAPTAVAADGDLRAVGLSPDGKRLSSFDTDRPGRARDLGAVTGLAAGETKLVGIDYRPSNGTLYGVGDKGGVYSIDGATASRVSGLDVALEGTAFGVDFNPVVDRLRIVSDTGQNLRDDVDTDGDTVADGRLTYPATTPPAPPAPTAGVTAAAYTNNDGDAATATTLFDIDTANDQVVIQSPANAGTLVATGKLGVDAVGDAGFDVHADLDDGAAEDNTAYAALKVGDRYALYAVDLLTGEVSKEGDFSRDRQVSDLAIALDRG